jgi:hypothetical protein
MRTQIVLIEGDREMRDLVRSHGKAHRSGSTCRLPPVGNDELRAVVHDWATYFDRVVWRILDVGAQDRGASDERSDRWTDEVQDRVLGKSVGE